MDASISRISDAEMQRHVTVHDHFDVPADPDSEDGRATIAAMGRYIKTGETPVPGGDQLYRIITAQRTAREGIDGA